MNISTDAKREILKITKNPSQNTRILRYVDNHQYLTNDYFLCLIINADDIYTCIKFFFKLLDISLWIKYLSM